METRKSAPFSQTLPSTAPGDISPADITRDVRGLVATRQPQASQPLDRRSAALVQQGGALASLGAADLDAPLQVLKV